MRAWEIDWKLTVLNARSLAGGMLAGVVLVVLYTIIFWTFRELNAAPGKLLITANGRAWLAAIYGTIAAILIVTACAPIWFIIIRRKLANYRSALLLGLVTTFAYWLTGGINGETSRDPIIDGIIYSICGALAGATTWRNARVRNEDQPARFPSTVASPLAIIWLAGLFLFLGLKLLSAATQ